MTNSMKIETATDVAVIRDKVASTSMIGRVVRIDILNWFEAQIAIKVAGCGSLDQTTHADWRIGSTPRVINVAKATNIGRTLAPSTIAAGWNRR
jgi:hypothetical protein